MNKVSLAVFIVLGGLLAAWVASHDGQPSLPPRAAETLDAGLADAELADAEPDGSADRDSETPDAKTPAQGAASEAVGDAFDGGMVGDLVDAPKSVKFGVVLVQYAGAQGAGRKARPKSEAQKLSQQLFEEAKSDFAAAVSKGDPGSAEKAGRMFRGILEPRVEFALFSLGKGEVGGPVDTPRGFWVVKRLD